MLLALASAAGASGLVFAPAMAPAAHRATPSMISMVDLDATRDAAPVVNAFDDEGGMVKGIAEGGQSWEDVVASHGMEGPKLSPEKQALCVLKEPEFNVNKMAVSATDEDYVIECSAMGDAELIIEVEPSMNTYEEYFYGLTADSASQISVSAEESSPIEGKMDRRGGKPNVIKLKFEPNAVSGEFIAHLCFILPEEPMYSKYYEIKGIAT